MSEEPAGGGKLSVADAIRLKHHYNKKVTYGSSALSAEEVQKALKPDYSGWKERWKKYDAHQKDVGTMFVNSFVSWGAVLVAAGLYWFEGWIRTAGIAVFAWWFFSVVKAAGHREGYFDGYEDGVYFTKKETLNVSDPPSRGLRSEARTSLVRRRRHPSISGLRFCHSGIPCGESTPVIPSPHFWYTYVTRTTYRSLSDPPRPPGSP